MLSPVRRTRVPPDRPDRHFAVLSFRWEAGVELPRHIQAELAGLGMGVCMELSHIRAGRFEKRLLEDIERSPNFIVILSPEALLPCTDPSDWFRQEIAHAIRTDRNVVPVLKGGFRFPAKVDLPPDLVELPRYNCVEHSPAYLAATLDRVIAFCTRPGPNLSTPR